MSYGSVAGMIISLKNNKIPKRDSKLGHLEYVKGVPIGKPLRFKNKMSADQLAELSEKLQNENKRQTRRTIIIYTICILTVCLTAIYYLN